MEGDAEHLVAEGGVAQGLARERPVATSHRRALLSAPPEARRAPSGLKARARTAFSCPLRGSPRVRVRASQSWIWRSRPAVANVAGGAEGDRLYLTLVAGGEGAEAGGEGALLEHQPSGFAQRTWPPRRAAPRASRETTAPRRRAVSGRTLSWVTAGPATPLSSAREAC